jgi:hypothetical protein
VQVAGRRTWARAVVLYLAGGLAASATVGWAAGLLGGLIGLPHIAMVAGLLATFVAWCMASDLGIPGIQVPRLPRQTPGWYSCQFGPVWTSMLWGVDLGLAWTTGGCFASYYAALAIAVWSSSPIVGLFVLTPYGLGRGLPLVLAGMLPDHLRPAAPAYANALYLVAKLGSATLLAAGAGVVIGGWLR